MPEWIVEPGIGETRAALMDDGEIVAGRVEPEGIVRAGTVLRARLKSGGRPAVAVAERCEYLLPKGAPGVTDGAELAIEVIREAIAGSEPWKRPLARLSDAAPGDAPPIEGRRLAVPDPSDELDKAGWADLIEEARCGIVRFAGGELRISATPAMTLIDVDGVLPPQQLAISGAAAAARAILRFDIGGSIGIDLPTLSGKAPRVAAAEAIDAILPQPFERTAMNGFGFLQIVRPRRRASLVELAQDRASFEARALLRLAAREKGAIRITAHPAVSKVLAAQPSWIATLSRQVGGAVTLREDPALPMSGGYAGHA